jgi:hypothetical protein
MGDLAAGCTHFAYKFFLTYAYDRGDLSRVYPLRAGRRRWWWRWSGRSFWPMR